MSEGNLIDAVCDRITFDKLRLEKNELGRIEVESFNLSEFWTQFGAAVQSLSNEVTKVGFACGKKPFPTGGEVDSMMQDLLQYYTVMRDLYLVLPPDVGTVLHKMVTSAVVAIMASLLDLVNSLHNLTEKGAKERLTLTGTFWDACSAVDALPKDNFQATLKVLESEVDLASDAQEELEAVEQGKIKPGISELEVISVRTDPGNPVRPEKIISEKDCFDIVSGNGKNRINTSQSNGEPLVREHCESKENQHKENKNKIGQDKPKLIILTGTDFKNLEKWIEAQLHSGNSPRAEVMQNKINRITQLVLKLETDPNDSYFVGMTESQKKEKYAILNKKLEEFLAMKKIMDTEPQQYKKMLSKVNLNSLSEEVTNRISDAEGRPQNVLNSDKHGCKNELELAVSTPTGEQLQKDIAVDRHVNIPKGKEYLQTVSVNNTQSQGSNTLSQSVNISVNLDYPCLSSAASRCSSEIIGNKRKINLGSNNGEPLEKTPRTEFCLGNQTNVNVSICSSVRVTSQKEEPGSDINTDAQFTVSLADVHATKVPQAVGSHIQATTNTLPASRRNCELMKNPPSNLDHNAAAQSCANQSGPMRKRFQDFVKSLDTTKQSPFNVQNNNVRPLRKPYQLPFGVDKLPEMINSEVLNCIKNFKGVDKLPKKSNLEVNNHVKNVKGLDLVNINNKFMQVENSDMSKTKSVQDIGLITSVQKPVRKFEELIHMLMPTPSPYNCSTAFLYYYPHLKITEALENIARRNPRLKCKEWVVYREWWDEQRCYNALLWTDIDSFRELEAQGLTARVTYRYYAFFRRASIEPHERMMPNNSQALRLNRQSMNNSFTPALISDYRHGLSCNFSAYRQNSVNISQTSTASVSCSFTPVQVTDYRHGLSGCPSTCAQQGVDKSDIYSPSQPTSDSSDEDPSQPTAQVTTTEVITDYTEIFF